MTGCRLRLVIAALTTALAACGRNARSSTSDTAAGSIPSAQARFAPLATDSAPRVLRIGVKPGVALEVLEWGGQGRPLIFLPGGGDTAHEFDSFAPLLTKSSRVFGITYQGAGASSHVAPKSVEDHVSNVVAVLDSLHLRRAVLVGHSFAGTVMALFGEEHADRCAGLVYLDAAYDYTDPALERLFSRARPPHGPPMRSADSSSVEAVQAWIRRTQGFTMPLSEIRASRRFDAQGRLVGLAPNEATGVPDVAPHWDRVRCPSLGIYAVPTPYRMWLPYYDSLDAAARDSAEVYYAGFAAWTAAQRAEFGRYPQNSVVGFPSAGHYFFLVHPERAARMIEQWVSARP